MRIVGLLGERHAQTGVCRLIRFHLRLGIMLVFIRPEFCYRAEGPRIAECPEASQGGDLQQDRAAVVIHGMSLSGS